MELDKLPYDTVFIIFDFLRTNEVLNVSSVSKKKWGISELARSDKYWKDKYEELIKTFSVENLEEEQMYVHDKMKSYIMKYKVVKLSQVSVPPLKELRDIKVILIGDGTVGKTSLLIRYCNNKFTTKYLPTIFDNKVAKVRYNDQLVGINLWDVAGEEDYDTLRPLSYQCVDVFCLCFDISNINSFENVREKWFAEVERVSKEEKYSYVGATTETYKYILCGMKSDIRDDVDQLREFKERGKKIVTLEDAMIMKEEIGAWKYFETSAKTRKNVDELFLGCLDCMFRGRNEEFDLGAHFLGKKKKKKKGDDSKCFVM